MITLYTDAATNPKTNVSACGILIIQNGKQIQLKFDLPNSDNHEAEFHAAILAFQLLLRDYVTAEAAKKMTVRFFTDSQILADSIQKKYAKHYQNLVDQLLELQDQFQLVLSMWVPEKQNRGAHQLAMQGLHHAESKN